MNTIQSCRKCNAVLVVGENWTEGLVKARTYLCQPCNIQRGKDYYKRTADAQAVKARERRRVPSAIIRDSEYQKSFYATHKYRWAGYRETEKEKEQTDPWRKSARMLAWIRNRAAKRNFEFDLTREWIAEKLVIGKCEATGIEIELRKPEGFRFYPWAPSIDRVDSKKGYTQDNCRLVCWIYNMAKSEWDDSHVLVMAKALASR